MNITIYSPGIYANLTLPTWTKCGDSPVAKWMYSVTNIMNVMVGVPVNSWVLWLIATGVVGTMASEVFTLSLAVSELLYCLVTPLMIVYGHVKFSDIIESFLIFCSGFTMVGRPLFHCCTCVERYLAVVYPLTYLRYRPLRYRLACSAVVWIMTIGYSIAVSTSLLFDPVYINVCIYLLIIIVQSFCSLLLLRALGRPGPGEGEREKQGNPGKMRAFRIVLVTLVSTMVSYLALTVAFLLRRKIPQAAYCMFSRSCFTLTLFNGFVQPLLYLHRAGKLPCIRIS